MAERFFSETAITGPLATLAGSEAHHLLHVMRAKPGDRVMLFDGSGAEFLAQVQRTRRAEVQLEILDRSEVNRERAVPITLGVAMPKGDRQKWLVEKAVELGVGVLVPLETERSVAQPGAEAVSRLMRSVIEASKQCGRNKLMRIEPAQRWPEFLRSTAAIDLRLVAHPVLQRPAAPPTTRPAAVALAIGPEGGLTDDEVAQALAAGWQQVSLGPRILRIETAAVYLVAALGEWESRD